MAWRQIGDKPLSEPMMVNLLTHICVTRPQWVKKRTHKYIKGLSSTHDTGHPRKLRAQFALCLVLFLFYLIHILLYNQNISNTIKQYNSCHVLSPESYDLLKAAAINVSTIFVLLDLSEDVDTILHPVSSPNQLGAAYLPSPGCHSRQTGQASIETYPFELHGCYSHYVYNCLISISLSFKSQAEASHLQLCIVRLLHDSASITWWYNMDQ